MTGERAPVRATRSGTTAAALACGLLLALGSTASALAQLPPVFQIEGGYVSGMAADTEDTVRAFLGIPYAAPPVGELRWRPPQRVVGWDALYEAIVPGPACPQAPYGEDSFYSSPSEEQSEDCLYLNIWTGARSPEERRPVMVWIHGGALTRGSGTLSTYDGTALARKGVVVVTLNYRLGPLGYLAHPALSEESEHGSSGNYGVLDQIAALEWVKRNIAFFGGDPERVTVFGESAGSWSVNALMATPLARGLFHRAIGQSGGLFAPMPHLDRDLPGLPSAESVGVELTARLGIEPGPEALAELRALPAERLIEASEVPGAFRTRPAVDGWVFPAEVREVFSRGEQADVPVIVGSTADEATTLLGNAVPAAPAAFEGMARHRFGELADDFLALYPPGTNGDATRTAALASFRDEWFTCEMRTWARLMETVKSDAWVYHFTRVPPHPEKERWGAFHAAEIPYAFDNLGTFDFEVEPVDRELAEVVSELWVSFAADGVPEREGTPEWPVWQPDARRHLVLGDEVTVADGLADAACDLFDRYDTARRGASASSAE